jgi:hypothetical protein
MSLRRDVRCRICAARQGVETIGRPVAVVRASSERRGGSLDGRAGGRNGDGPRAPGHRPGLLAAPSGPVG